MAQPTNTQTFLGILFFIVALAIGFYSKCDGCKIKQDTRGLLDNRRGCN